MVSLKDLKSQWPWNRSLQPETLSDKEIYTHRVESAKPSFVWRIPVLPPLNGYAYTGMRIVVYGKDDTYTMDARLQLKATESPMFGLPCDTTSAKNGSWAPLGFPLTNKLLRISQDGLEYVVRHDELCWGKVEFVAQRFQDLQEDEADMSYIFLHNQKDKVLWVLNKENNMYKPHPALNIVFRNKVKIIPSIPRLLDTGRNDWPDEALYWSGITISIPFLMLM